MDGVEEIKTVLWMKHPNTERTERAAVEVKDGVIQITEGLFEQMMRDLGWIKLPGTSNGK